MGNCTSDPATAGDAPRARAGLDRHGRSLAEQYIGVSTARTPASLRAFERCMLWRSLACRCGRQQHDDDHAHCAFACRQRMLSCYPLAFRSPWEAEE